MDTNRPVETVISYLRAEPGSGSTGSVSSAGRAAHGDRSGLLILIFQRKEICMAVIVQQRAAQLPWVPDPADRRSGLVDT
jgi:hypothetical protein